MPGWTRVSGTNELMFRTPAGAIGLVLTLALVAMALLADALAPADPFASVAPPLAPPSRAHAFGTDDLGRDVLAGIIHGARTSLLVVASVTALAAITGVAVGAVSGSLAGAL